MNLTGDEKCEVCQAPARHHVQDVKEGEPVEHNGERFANYEKDGPLHHFCPAHRRPAKMERRPAQ